MSMATATRTRPRRGLKVVEPEPATVRCVIYTRKSTEEGLDSDFNSLDAQREAGEAYVQSQRAEGWACLPERYDDGGFTGGNIERPALQRLLDDIRAGKVDCVVVYKVDRLSRSLMDFARIVAVFEKHGVSFVSVTQQFNTSTSMGRLMLNVLFSFAQFEREIIGERTRDKLAAARKKGKWIGGQPVLGYDIDREAKRLVVNEAEAELVRMIFGIYLQEESLIRTVAQVDKRGIRTKSWTSKKGNEHGGRLLDKSALHRMLSNVAYVGKVSYKGEVYEGEQDGIVEPELFERVQALLGHNGKTYGATVRNRHGALLARLIWCPACGTHFTHVPKRKGQRLYRYYTCIGAMKRGWSTCPNRSIPAHEIENFVVERIREIGRNPSLVKETVRQVRSLKAEKMPELEAEHARLRRELTGLNAELRTLVEALGRGGSKSATLTERIGELEERVDRTERRATETREELVAIERETVDEKDLAGALAQFDPVWDVLFPREKRRILRLLIERIEWDRQAGTIDIVFQARRHQDAGRRSLPRKEDSQMNDAAPQMRVRFDVEFSNGRTGHKRLRERRPKPKEDTPPAPSRVARLLALAHDFDDMIREGVVRDQAEIARLMKVTRAWVTRIMNLLYLTPDIQEAVLFLTTRKEGPTPTMRQLQPLAGEVDWAKQRARWRTLACRTAV